MKVHTVGVILNGVTGRMGTNQHLIRSILAIRKQGGVKINNNEVIMPDPVLMGRGEKKIKKLAESHGLSKYSTDLSKTLANPENQIYFDTQITQKRVESVLKAIDAKKVIYCEKPTADSLDGAIKLYQQAKKANVKNGVVQDKLFLPGIRKFQEIKEQGVLGKILAVRGEFGYWVFTGHEKNQPAQRPSWNYRDEDGGGIIVDMHCHWRYVIDNLFGNVNSVLTVAESNIKERIDENNQPYVCTADDSAYAMFRTENGIICQFNSSWSTRVRRDDLLTIQVDGTQASAIIGLRKCWIQKMCNTPKLAWNPDIDNPIDLNAGWEEVLPEKTYHNAFKAQWELFLRHVVLDEPFPWDLREGAKGVQLAEKSLESHANRRWIDLDELPV